MQDLGEIIHVRGNRSINPPSEHDPCTRIRHGCRRQMRRSRARRIVYQLDIIRHHDVGQHEFQLARSKETSWAIIPSVKACS